MPRSGPSVAVAVLAGVLAGVLAPWRPVAGQRVADLTPVGADLTVLAAPAHDSAARGPAPVLTPAAIRGVGAPARRAAPDRRRRVWPWYVLGGAVLGAGAGTAFSFYHGCPAGSGCRDDGGLAWTPVIAGVFALGGAAVGGVVGGLVEAARHHPTPAGPRPAGEPAR